MRPRVAARRACAAVHLQRAHRRLRLSLVRSMTTWSLVRSVASAGTLSDMRRHQSAQNARRFSQRRRPAERTRRPSCRHALGRGEPLLRPEAVGPARYSRHAESLACAARGFISPSRFHCPIMALIGPSDLPWMPSRKPKIRLRKGPFTGTAGSYVATAAVRGEQSRRMAACRRVR